jgi:hypothetical protein
VDRAQDAASPFTRSALRLLERVRRNKSGWGESHLSKLYEGFGFVARDVGNHVHYRHPDHPQVGGQVPRHRSLRDYVVADAVATIDELLRVEAEEDREEKP